MEKTKMPDSFRFVPRNESAVFPYPGFSSLHWTDDCQDYRIGCCIIVQKDAKYEQYYIPGRDPMKIKPGSSILPIILITLALVLVGCAPKTVTRGGTLAVCPPEFLHAPLYVSPTNNDHTSLTPILDWDYPEVHFPADSENLCHPEKYRITYKKGPLFMEAGGAFVDGDQTSYQMPALQAGAEYTWSVSSMTLDANGPFAGIWRFFVGENCETGPLTAPILLQPFNGATLNHLVPTLVWQSSTTCIPSGYHVDIATDPQFANIVFNTETPDPLQTFQVPNPLSNCTRYYWRVGALMTYQVQPFSETFSFRVATEGCEAEPGAGSIVGKVWRDQCSVPHDGSIPSPMPAGCTAVSDGTIADGIRQAGEFGIADVIVRVGAGDCGASTPLGLTITDSSGDYYLHGLQGGTYCISIDSSENPIWLGGPINGWWTQPQAAYGTPIASFEIDLASDQDLPGVDFGWQFDNSDEPVSTNTLGGVIYHDLCAIPIGVGYNGPLLDGCVQHDGYITGDWQRQEGEAGIPGVTVTAHENMCSNPVSQTTVTDAQGHFSFNLASGIAHCIIVDSLSGANAPVLQYGVWSINPANPVYEYSFNFNGTGQTDLEYFSFAWDYAQLPDFPTGEPTPLFEFPIFTPGFDLNCREGPAIAWPILAKVKSGMQIPVLMRTVNNDWLQLKPAGMLNKADFPGFEYFREDLRCWVMSSNGKLEGSLDGVEAYFGPSDPTAQPTQVACANLAESACKAQPTCEWIEPLVTVGYCTDK